jgi:hypothetical protein
MTMGAIPGATFARRPRAAGWVIVVLAWTLAGACSITGTIGSDVGGSGAATSSVGGSGTTTSSSISLTAALPFDKIDLLLVVDNTRAMTEKQQILADALLELTQTLANPPCLDASGASVADQPSGPFDSCPTASTRKLPPVLDIHVGVVSSSIGGHGSDACKGPDTTSCSGGVTNTSIDDHGRLVTRVDPCGTAVVPTYANRGFLAWDPGQQDDPPGETDLADLIANAQALTLGTGDLGCAYPSQLESWYRFLVAPDPYESLAVSNGQVVASGVDAVLMAQRQDFLRPDSLLAILMLSDADDCSVVESGTSYLATQLQDPNGSTTPYHLPRARAECAIDTGDPCCLPCTEDAGACPVDPACVTSPTLDAASDGYGLRCWNQKQRFGADFLYPVSRYVQGLTSSTVPNREGEMVLNPIFSAVGGSGDAGVRDASLVVLAGVVGVPWQDVARDATDLGQGFKTSAELAGDGGPSAWAVILGDPDAGVLPLDPHMIASTFPRTGVDPVTGTALAPASAGAGADPISGHEYTQATPNDLQYACTFALRTALDCSVPGVPACDCADPQNDDPLCAPDPSKSGQRTLQVGAKAYPALRQLQVLHGLGAQGVVASICPAQDSDATRLDYGYHPAIRALVDWVTARAGGP